MSEPLPPLQSLSPNDELEGVYQNAAALLEHEQNVREGNERKTATIQQGEWEWAAKYVTGYDTMSPDWLAKYSRFNYGEACAVIEELQAQGKMSCIYDVKKGGYLVLKDDHARQRELNSVRVPEISAHRVSQNTSRLGRMVAKITASQDTDADSDRRAELQRLKAAWEERRRWNLTIGTRPIRIADGKQSHNQVGLPNQSGATPDYLSLENLDRLDEDMKRAVEDAVHREKDARGVVKLPPDDFKRIANEARRRILRDYLGGSPSDNVMGLVEQARRVRAQERREQETSRSQQASQGHYQQGTQRRQPQSSPSPSQRTRRDTSAPTSGNDSASRSSQFRPLRPQTNSTSNQPPRRPASRRTTGGGEQRREQAKDNWELALMYLSGTFSRDDEQPPSMSPESLASRYVSYFKLFESGVRAGLSERAAREQAKNHILPAATKHFRLLQQRGFIAADYVKIDPKDPAHDRRVTGHKVIGTKAALQAELELYRQYGRS